MKEVEVFTDGACRGNPGRGGCACVLLYRDQRKELSVGFQKTTNNRMELRAVIMALEALKEPCRVSIYSDSKYVVNAVNKHWLSSWSRNFWRKADKKPVLNVDLWKLLDEMLKKHSCKFTWVKGHASNVNNNRCDELATAIADGGNLSTDSGFVESYNDSQQELF